MDRQQRSRMVGGLVLVGLGLLFLVLQVAPNLVPFVRIEYAWPLIVVGIGALLLLFGLLSGEPGMAVPACVVGGIGLLLYWQNLTGQWETWAYAWTLIPGFVGIGTLLMGLLGERPRESITGGGWLILISGIMFVIFSAIFGGPNLLGPYWPVLLILAGVLFLLRAVVRPAR
jgi:hypothetical protein